MGGAGGPGGDLPAGLVVVGANHRSSGVMLRDRIFVEDAAAPEFLARLGADGIAQALVLSTCDRVEVQALHGDPALVGRAVVAALAGRARLEAEAIRDQFYRHEGEAALRHMFAVAASLDSQVIGESQVPGQLRAGLRLARDCGASGPGLEAAVGAALAAARRVRNETGIGQRPVSIATAAVQLARDIVGDPARASALLLGDGEMGEILAEQLLAAGLRHLVVAAPSGPRAGALARRLACNTVPFDIFATALDEADIVIAAVGRRQRLMDTEMVSQALVRRRRRPVFLVDTSIPGDIEPGAGRVEGAFLYDLGDLERIALDGQASRQSGAADAWRILDEELAGFLRDRRGRRAGPAIAGFRERAEALRQEVLVEAGDDADRATSLLLARLLHEPSGVLRRIGEEEGEAALEAARQLLERLFRPAGTPSGNGEKHE